MLAEVTGTVTFGKETKGKQRLIITGNDGVAHETLISKDKTVLVHDGQVVQKGEEVVDGRSIRTTSSACSASRSSPATSSTKCRTFIVCRV